MTVSSLLCFNLVGDLKLESTVTTGEFEQPKMFKGVLKHYQLKGLNWLASLYDQVCYQLMIHMADKLDIEHLSLCVMYRESTGSWLTKWALGRQCNQWHFSVI